MPSIAPSHEHDKQLYDEMQKLFRSNDIIKFLSDNNMDGFPFENKRFDPLREYYYEWNKAEKKFNSSELEELRKAIWDKIAEYLNLLTYETFCVNSDPNYYSVPSEWKTEQSERFWNVVNKFHSLAGEIVELHTEFINTGRKELMINEP